jgi:hypothetical protein
VETRADVEAKPAQLLSDHARAPDRPRRPVEGGQEAVAGRVHLAALEALELPADGSVVRGEQVAPTAVAELDGLFASSRRRP